MVREFHELKLGQYTIDYFVNKFMSLLRYVPYLKEKKAKIQRFINCLPFSYKERIEFDQPKTMDKTIRKAKLYFNQSKKKGENYNG